MRSALRSEPRKTLNYGNDSGRDTGLRIVRFLRFRLNGVKGRKELFVRQLGLGIITQGNAELSRLKPPWTLIGNYSGRVKEVRCRIGMPQ